VKERNKAKSPLAHHSAVKTGIID